MELSDVVSATVINGKEHIEINDNDMQIKINASNEGEATADVCEEHQVARQMSDMFKLPHLSI